MLSGVLSLVVCRTQLTWESSGGSNNFEKGEGRRQCISSVVMYRDWRCCQLCLLCGKRRLIEKKILANSGRPPHDPLESATACTELIEQSHDPIKWSEWSVTVYRDWRCCQLFCNGNRVLSWAYPCSKIYGRVRHFCSSFPSSSPSYSPSFHSPVPPM